MENGFYRVTADPHKGALRSILDRRRDTELVDSAAAYGMGQYIHAGVSEFYEESAATGKSGFASGAGERYIPVPVRAPAPETGPAYSRLDIAIKLDRGPSPAQVGLDVLLYRGYNRVVLQASLSLSAFADSAFEAVRTDRADCRR